MSWLQGVRSISSRSQRQTQHSGVIDEGWCTNARATDVRTVTIDETVRASRPRLATEIERVLRDAALGE